MLEQGANFHAIGAEVGKYEYLLKYRYIYVCTYMCIHMYLYLYLYLCLYLDTYISHGTDAGAGGKQSRYRRGGWKVRIFIEISIYICMHIYMYSYVSVSVSISITRHIYISRVGCSRRGQTSTR